MQLPWEEAPGEGVREPGVPRSLALLGKAGSSVEPPCS